MASKAVQYATNVESGHVLEIKPPSCSIVGRRFANNLEDHALVVNPMTWDSTLGTLTMQGHEAHAPSFRHLDQLSSPKHPPRKYFTWKPLSKAADPSSGPAAHSQRPGWRTPGLYRPNTSHGSGDACAEGQPQQGGDANAAAGTASGGVLPATGASAGVKPNSYGSSTLQAAMAANITAGAGSSNLGRPATADAVQQYTAASSGNGSGIINSSRNMLEAMRASYGVLFTPPGIYDDDSDTEEQHSKAAGASKECEEGQQAAAAPVKTEGERRRWARRLAAEQQLSGKWGEKDFTWGGALRKKNTHLAIMAPAGNKSIQRSAQHGNSSNTKSSSSSRLVVEPDVPPPPHPDYLQTGPWAGEKWNSCRSSAGGTRRSCMGSTAGNVRSSMAGSEVRSSVGGSQPAAGSTAGATGMAGTARSANGSGLPGPGGNLSQSLSGGSSSRLSYISRGTGVDTEPSSEWKRDLPFTAALLSGRAWKMGEAFAAARPATAAPGTGAGTSIAAAVLKQRSDQQLKQQQKGLDTEDGSRYDAAITTGGAPTLRLRACTAR